MNCSRCGASLNEFEGECRECLGEGVTRQLSALPRRLPCRRAFFWSGVVIVSAAMCSRLWFSYPKQAQPQQPVPVPQLPPSQQVGREGVLEAALRNVVAEVKPRYDAKGLKTIVFVMVGGRDVSGSFVSRFKNSSFSVRKWSQAKQVAAKNEFQRNDGYLNPVFKRDYLDRATGEQGVPVPLGEPQWHGNSEAWVDMPFGFGSGHLIIKWQDGSWRVIKREQTIFF